MAPSSVMFRVATLISVVVLTSFGVNSLTAVQLSCPPEWTLHGDRCYKLYTHLSSWQYALDICKIDGALLSRIEDTYTNNRLGSIASASGITSFWIGLNRNSVPRSNASYSQWSDGAPSTVYQAFWEEMQPDLSAGSCVYVFESQGKYRWSLGTCEWKRAFICELSACPSGSFQCSTGECIQSSRTCDGTQDCSDGSDEIDCPSLCKRYIKSSGGNILSNNFPGGYPIFSKCQWTLEGPIGSNIFLEVNTIDTESGVDELVILGGGKTASTSQSLTRLSGVTAPASMVRSTNNFMIIQFFSDGDKQGTGFNLTWSSVKTSVAGEGLQVAALTLSQFLQTSTYPAPYLTNQETLWVLSTLLDRTVITLTREDVDLAPGDYIYIRDGDNANAPLLAQYTAGNDGPKAVISTGPHLYILMETGRNTAVTNRGFRFSYRSGCEVNLIEDTGEIFSPGYGVVNYPNFVTCTFFISPSSMRRTTLIFNPQYDIEFENDKLKVYLGSNENDNPMFPTAEGGYIGTVAPSPVTANDGRIYVRFETNAVNNKAGWHATYSYSCPDPNFNGANIVTPPVGTDYGSSFNVSCPVGFVFNAAEFYTRQLKDGSFASADSVYMECLKGGSWNVRRYPQCVPADLFDISNGKYCDQAPEIKNGYVQSATGAVFGSTATYVCEDTFSAVGNVTVTCQEDGTWQTPPTCTAVTCSDISSSTPQDGSKQLVQGTGTSAGSVYRYDCIEGFVISGSPITYCNSSGVWTYPVPSCERLKCPVPTLDNGRIFNGGLSLINYAQSLAVTCNSSYKVNGKSTIACQANQTFTDLPVCEDVNECLGNPCGSNYICQNTEGAFTCTCPAGYQVIGANCVDVVECDVDNGGCSHGCDNSVGSYSCSCPVGYTLFEQNGIEGYFVPATETGLRFGDFYYINHTCVLNQCQAPDPVNNGYLTQSLMMYTYGDTVTYRCSPGFVLTGQHQLTCLANGNWSASSPTCNVAKCPPVVLPKNLVNAPTSISPAGEVDFGSSIDITCFIPGIGTVTKKRTCQFDPGQQVYRLQGDSYECGEVDCGTPLLPPGGVATTPSATTYNNTFLFSCDQLHDVEGSNNLGNNIITCGPDSYWTFFNIICLRRQCPFPGIPTGGEISFEGSGYNFFDNVTFSCSRKGFEPEAAGAQCVVNENGTKFEWNAPTPACVDVEPPTFIDCPASPVNVSYFNPAGFPVPTPQDNSGGVKSTTVSPAYFHPSQPIAEDITVTYTTMDHANLTAQCVVNIVVMDGTPPSVQCPGAEVIRLSISDTNYRLYDPSSANVVYDSKDAVLTFSPSEPLNYSYAEVGTVSTFKAVVRDASGNEAECQFQVVIEALLCEPLTKSGLNSQAPLCVPTATGGHSCTIQCNSGYYFYDDYPSEVFVTTCEPGQPYSPSYIPSCVESAQVLYNVAPVLVYEASPSATISEACQQAFTTSILSKLIGLQITFTQLCSSQQSITSVSYNTNSLKPSFDNVTLQVEFSLLLNSLALNPFLEYTQCDGVLRTEFLSLSLDSGSFLTLRNLSVVGCPDVTGYQKINNVERTCTSDYKQRVTQPNGRTFCLPCAPGTSKSDAGVCELCPVSKYWVTDQAPDFGQCVDCSRGRTTLTEGSIGAQACKDRCDGNFVSSLGIAPCSECTGNSFALNSTYCQECPTDRLALRKENPLNPACNNRPCTYSTYLRVDVVNGNPIQSYAGTSQQCEEFCNQWELLPFTTSECTGFSYNKNPATCLLYDSQPSFVSNTDRDYYVRQCTSLDPTECFCAPKCPAGYYSVTGYQPDCRPCPMGYISATSAATSCQACPAGQTTQSQASTSCVQDGASVVCLNNPCQNNGKCSVLFHDAYCTCEPGFTGRYCEQTINFCSWSPCYNNASCFNTLQGYSCLCLPGFRGDRCEENVDNCTPNSCSGHGTCVDGVNSFSCDCVDNYSGARCEVQVQNGCDIFPCSGNSTCRATNDYHRVCDCLPGFTGPLCDKEIDECESQPCLNGGTCIDKVNSYECICRSNFTGDQCKLRDRLCSMFSCGVVDRCVDDPVTGLPLCFCSEGYTQGQLCQYSFTIDRTVANGTPLKPVTGVQSASECRSLCDAEGDSCQAFVYRTNIQLCLLYSKVVSTVATNVNVEGPHSLSIKSCSYPTDDYIYTEWFNSMNPVATDRDMESYNLLQSLGLTVCENTDPIAVECRVAGTQAAIPAGVQCELSGLTCVIGQNVPANSICPDMEIRFKCARSRVFEGVMCNVHDICSERGNCANTSQCVNDPSDPKGYHCVNCALGYTGSLCQLTTDECANQPCLNGGTCVDGFLTYTCNCPTGFKGNRCETNPDDCNGACDSLGTLRCEDGLDDFTCICNPGYESKNCSENIDDCASNPCLHDSSCTDQVNGYQCTCTAGWTGDRCETIVDSCSLTSPCANNASCTTLFNDFSCTCPPGVYGAQCQVVPSLYQCIVNNPCVDVRLCRLNGTQALCSCADGSTGAGCELYVDNNCDNTQCQNGGTCSAGKSGPECNCAPGYSGDSCEVNIDECTTTVCPATASCIDGNNEAYCRCPVGKAAPTCAADINENYDMCFSPSLTTAGAALPYVLPVANLKGFTVMVWVRFQTDDGSGTFLTLYDSPSVSVSGTPKEILRLDEKGMNVNIFGSRRLSFDLFPINDGFWHLIVVFWNSATGDLDLTVDYLRQDRVRLYGSGQSITANLWLVLGGMKNVPVATSDSLQGCVSGVNVLTRGLDFTVDLPILQLQPLLYRGDLLRWDEFEVYGNTQFGRPSTARLVNCVANPSEPACITQTRDSVAPAVTFCPNDIIIDTVYSDITVSWTRPTFTGAVQPISASHQPGELFQQGSTTVVYTATDQAGNTAVCSFNVFVGSTACPALDAPRGGGVQVCQLQADNFDACSASCPGASAVLVDEVPVYYTCGPSGSWETLQDHGGLYPTCGRKVGQARANVKLTMNYRITTGQCPTITQSIVAYGQEELTTMQKAWGGNMCSNADCSDVVPTVDCSTLLSTNVEILLTNVSTTVMNGPVARSMADVWEAAVLDDGVFNFDSVIPAAALNKQSFSVQVTYICEEGQVAREQICVECGPGTFYNSSTLHCDNCPLGQYMSGYAALACDSCPQGQTTRSIGSTQPSECGTICPLGQYFNGSSCTLCAKGFYQNQTGQFECKPCPRGYLTLIDGSTSMASCTEGCQSGYELLVNGSCTPCAEGTYRKYGLDQTCTPCPSDYTTLTSGSESADNCTVLRCPVGSSANANVTSCELCPVGQYQPLINQLNCISCAVNFTTAKAGSVKDSDCQQFCPSGHQLVNGQCERCPVAFYKDNTVDPLSQCLPCRAGYLTASDASTAASDCSIRNCTTGFFIQSDQQGVETCALCPLDQFSDKLYQKSCSPCPSGTGTRQTGADSDSLCEALCQSGQELLANGTCVPCQQGSYKDNGVDRFAQCTVCPSENITAGPGATSLSDCNIRNCSAGSFREVGTNTCKECPVNTYQPDKWQTTCLDCPKERLTQITGATSINQCLLSCSPGREDKNGVCTECPVGFYKNITGAVACTPCPSGYRTAAVGSQEEALCNVLACKPGSFLNALSSACDPCPYGQYQPAQWQDSCLLCDTNKTTLVLGATISSQCLTDCPVGTELNLDTNVCEPCQRGYYRDKSSGAQTSCVICPSDYITPSTGSTAASNCAVANCTIPGRYLNTATNTCVMCPIGTYTSLWWQELCTTCASGFTTKTAGIATEDGCYRDCPSGQQVDEATNVCSECQVGRYRDKSQDWTCQACPTPLTTGASGATDASDCNIPTCGPGLFYNDSLNACLACPLGKYQPQSSQRSCITCPDRKTTLVIGRVSAADCVSACQTTQNTCSQNAFCSSSATGSVTCTCKSNYEGDGSTCTHVCDRTDPYCKNGATCVKNRVAPCICLTYYSGPQCQTREDPSKSVDDTMVIVGVSIGAIALLLIIIIVIIGLVVRRKHHSAYSDKESVSTSASQSRPSSYIIPRINTQDYRSYRPDQTAAKTYDPAIYNPQGTTNRDMSMLAFNNATYRSRGHAALGQVE